MKKFIIVFVSNTQDDGVVSSVSKTFNSKEETIEELKRDYKKTIANIINDQNFMDEEDIDSMQIEDSCYSIGYETSHGYESVEATIEEVEVEVSANDYFKWYCKDYLEQYLDRKGINLSEEEIKSMSEHLTDNLLNSSHIWEEIDTEIEDNIAIDFVEQYKNKYTNVEYLRYNKGDTLFKVGDNTTDSDDIHHITEELLNTDYIKVKEWYEEG